jgi:hypothetical protein
MRAGRPVEADDSGPPVELLHFLADEWRDDAADADREPLWRRVRARERWQAARYGWAHSHGYGPYSPRAVYGKEPGPWELAALFRSFGGE